MNCTCHNDLGWLNTQEKTADFRSSDIILPALGLLKQYPEFLYSMECTAYLMEFLSRHPELRDEMAANMQNRRFTWGASYVECQEVHVGPEKLVRQFYFGRLWLKNTFPGVDTSFLCENGSPVDDSADAADSCQSRGQVLHPGPHALWFLQLGRPPTDPVC